jgi:4'-phosphopantetheinyl transferase
MPQHLGAAEIYLWYFLLNPNPERRLLERLSSVLSPEEQDARSRFLFDKNRHQYLFAHSLLRVALSRFAPVPCTDWRFEAQAYGKPQITFPPGQTLYFNLSHTDGLVACVIAREPMIGVDAEHLGRGGSLMEMARHFFAPAEISLLERTPPAGQREIFFDIWTLKEAYIKARGLGLSLPLDEFAFELAAGREPRIEFAQSMNDSPERWQFETLRPCPAHKIAVAARRPCGFVWNIITRRMTEEELSASIREVE